MIKAMTLLIAALLLTPISASAASIEWKDVCNGCTKDEANTMALTWIADNLTPKDTALIHIIDPPNQKVWSFSGTVEWIPLPPTPPGHGGTGVVPRTEEIQTPSRIQNLADSLVAHMNNLSEFFKSGKVPEDVIKNAWSFVNCAYCKADFRDYLDNQTQAGSIFRQVEDVSHALGILPDKLENKYVIELESGGRIFFEYTVTGNGEVDVNILEVLDEANNSVPLEAGGLENLQVRVVSDSHGNTINVVIVLFDYYIPEKSGTFVIQECPTNPTPPSPCS
ncbi:hypothetical protein [Microbulbifer celer]|uniref:Uncharacterized protein n=1 Tax=Microbulbifer celer TaxID=435905 RepID=A0ABW3UDP4_9GAMM|nr:hypothetical protein [Microbulbifer celer]UFN56246.1 hypothetical protein LPW13_11770 [Microbulbifer celer]